MKIRIYTWEEAIEAVKERDDSLYEDFADYSTIYGLSKDWEYWGKTVTTESFFKDFKGCYIDNDNWALPIWLYEIINDESETKAKKAEEGSYCEISQGWLCPRCNRIVSPYVNYCDCEGNYEPS